jgi:hypothetical protein
MRIGIIRIASQAIGWLFVVCVASAGLSQEAGQQPDEWITFLSHRTGGNILYKMRPSGAELTPLYGVVVPNVPSVVDGTTMYRSPHWTRQSPNKCFFASWVYEQGKPYSLWQGELRPMLVVGDLNKTFTRIVNPDCHEEFAWSPDSKRLAFSVFKGNGQKGGLHGSLRSTKIVTCGIDGSNEKVEIEQPGSLFVLDWSPDGKRLLLSRRYFDVKPEKSSDLFELLLATGECLPHLLDGSRDFDINAGRYSPRGEAIAILFTDPKNQYAPNECGDDELSKASMQRFLGKLAVIDSDGKNVRTVADFPDGMRGPISWSPDGMSVLVSRYLPKEDDREQMRADKEHGLSIWAIQRDGKGERFITTGWSPDWR